MTPSRIDQDFTLGVTLHPGVVFAGFAIKSADGKIPLWKSHLRVALALAPGLRALPIEPGKTDAAHTLLAAHITECLLKAFLHHKLAGVDELRRRPVRHNLVELWQRARKAGLPLSEKPPFWLESLHFLHDGQDYLLRYQENVAILVLPPPMSVREGVEQLIATVCSALPPASISE